MVVKKLFSCLLTLIFVSLILGGCSKQTNSTSQTSLKDKKNIQIGISQIVEHPALDAARKGFIEALKSKGFEEGKNITIDFQNAQGDIPTTQTISQNFVSQKKDIILAIATPCAQAAFNATKDIPILITAVTDPVKAGLVKSMDNPGTNVTGTSDNVSIEKQFELIKTLVPNAKRIGIIYNTSESNSEVQVQNAKDASSKFNFTIVPCGITNVNEIPQGIASLVGKIDVLYTPTDNIVASSMPLITKTCFDSKIPVIGAESAHVQGGALGSAGIDYFKLGFETGLKAVDIINGKKPTEVPVETMKEMDITVNIDSAKKLGISIPKDIEAKAKKISGGIK